ncbi:MAG: hypothetical protein WD356_03330 [Pseudomonadales bacterium]
MANLLVRNIDGAVVKALKARAGRHGVSVEEEHRRLLRSALLDPEKKSFAEALKSIPDVGSDQDFERRQGGDVRDVFD